MFCNPFDAFLCSNSSKRIGFICWDSSFCGFVKFNDNVLIAELLVVELLIFLPLCDISFLELTCLNNVVSTSFRKDSTSLHAIGAFLFSLIGFSLVSKLFLLDVILNKELVLSISSSSSLLSYLFLLWTNAFHLIAFQNLMSPISKSLLALILLGTATIFSEVTLIIVSTSLSVSQG